MRVHVRMRVCVRVRVHVTVRVNDRVIMRGSDLRMTVRVRVTI